MNLRTNPHKRFGYSRDYQSPNEGARDRTREREMIILGAESVLCILGRYPISGNVVYGLDVERFLDFCVGRNVEVEEDEARNEREQEPVCSQSVIIH